MKLTQEEQQELKMLRDKQGSGTMILMQDAFERLQYLNKKEFHNCCTNPRCTGYEGANEETICPVCGHPLFKLT